MQVWLYCLPTVQMPKRVWSGKNFKLQPECMHIPERGPWRRRAPCHGTIGTMVMYSVVCLSVCLFVYLSVAHNHESYRNGWTDPDAVWVVDSGGPKEPFVTLGPGSPRGRDNFGRTRLVKTNSATTGGVVCAQRCGLLSTFFDRL